MDEQGRFVGRGDLPNGWYVAGEDEDGLFRSYLVVVSEELQAGESIARVQLRCDEGEALEARIWWRDPSEVPSSLSWRVGDQPWRTERWRTPSGWTWGDDEWAVHAAVDALAFARNLLWSAGGGETLVVEYERDGQKNTASFDLDGLFDTPVQPNLARCGR